jgi:hypothetical protein
MGVITLKRKDKLMEFGRITLELVTPLHIGKGRCGMLAKSFGFVPGHIISGDSSMGCGHFSVTGVNQYERQYSQERRIVVSRWG